MPNRETLPASKTDANTKERPNTWKTKYDARTIPAGLNIHASLGWKCNNGDQGVHHSASGTGNPKEFPREAEVRQADENRGDRQSQQT